MYVAETMHPRQLYLLVIASHAAAALDGGGKCSRDSLALATEASHDAVP